MGEKHRDRSEVQKMLAALTRLWAFDQLSARPTGSRAVLPWPLEAARE